MICSPNPGGEVLYFSQKELAARCLAPERLTRGQCLALVRGALVQRQRPVPLCMELETFPCRQGVLVFVRPLLPENPEKGNFSVPFS